MNEEISMITNRWQLIAFALVAILAYLGNRAARATKGKVQELHLTLNSRLDQLIEATRKSARAEGVIEGAANERASQSRSGDAPPVDPL